MAYSFWMLYLAVNGGILTCFLSSFSILLFHVAATVWKHSWTAAWWLSCGSGRPLHSVVHHAPRSSKTRSAYKTSLPRRHFHLTRSGPAEQGRSRWEKKKLISDMYPQFSATVSHLSLVCFVLTVLVSAKECGLPADSDVTLSLEGIQWMLCLIFALWGLQCVNLWLKNCWFCVAFLICSYLRKITRKTCDAPVKTRWQWNKRMRNSLV